MRILVTGGAGFIGSAVVRHLIQHTRHSVVNVDSLTYAGNLDSVRGLESSGRYVFERLDINDGEKLQEAFDRHDPDAVMHLAAESHVDRSIDGPRVFVETNVMGTYNMLQASLRQYSRLSGARRSEFRHLHVSTDEVFGSLRDEGLFDPASPYQPNSPYSATKAAADHLSRAWHHTFGLPVLISNCSNNYGPYQFPEKLIPLTISNALEQRPLPVYGRGANVRDWLFVEDHACALTKILTYGRPGMVYLVGGNAERRNIDVVRAICEILDSIRPSPAGPHERLIEFVTDRPGHDFRYAVDASSTLELGWEPRHTFESGLRHTVEWYLSNGWWLDRIRSGVYRGERLGLISAATL